MRRALLCVLLLSLSASACTSAQRTPAPAPVLILSCARVSHTPTGVRAAGNVFLVEDGSARHLFASAPGIEAAVSPDGRWLLHSSETTADPSARQLRLYDLRSRRDTVLATDTFVSLGWADDRPLGVLRRGSAREYAYIVYYTPDQLTEMNGRKMVYPAPTPISLGTTSPPVHLSFLAMDRHSPYFLGDDGVWRAKWSSQGGMELAWSFPVRAGFSLEPAPPPPFPLPDAGVPRSALATMGLPMFGPPHGLLPSIESTLTFRRLGDGAERRTMTLKLRSTAFGPLPVLAPDASRYLRVERSGSTQSRPLGQWLAEYDSSGRRDIACASAADGIPFALGYVGEDVAYWTLKGRAVDIWLWERATGKARKLANLPGVPMRSWADGPRLVGVEYER